MPSTPDPIYDSAIGSISDSWADPTTPNVYRKPSDRLVYREYFPDTDERIACMRPQDSIEGGSVNPHKIIPGKSETKLKKVQNDTIDACITDPPYGVGILRAEWDKAQPVFQVYEQIHRVLKPGAWFVLWFGPHQRHSFYAERSKV
jgi:hypothetical protein